MNPRSILHILFTGLVVASITCSVAIRSGHADVPVAESADLIQPLKVGEKAPRFIIETVDGEAYDFNPDELEKPTLLLVYRGGWCPYCNTYLSEMRHVVSEIRALGIDVLFLSGDRPELLYESLSAETQGDIAGLDYTILSDADAQAAIALGIAFKPSQRMLDYLKNKNRDIDGSSMLRHNVIPVPAVFAIDKHGEIQFAFTNADYKVRLPADDLMAAARQIAAD